MDTARQAREWLACADACWAAARHLPDQEGRFQLPRLRLAGLAVEYRLRAFICLSRRGTPDSHDLGHLLRLARLCGLDLEPAHAEVITRLSRMHEGHPDVDGAPSMSAIDTVLARLPRDTAP